MKTKRIAKRALALLLVLTLCLGLSAAALAAGTADKIVDDVWTINFYVKENQQYVTVTRLKNAYTTSLSGVTIGGATYTVASAEAGTVLTDDYDKTCAATWAVPDYTAGTAVAVQEETEGLTVEINGGTPRTYSREDLENVITAGSLSYSGVKSDSYATAYYGIATEYITIPDLLSFLGVSGCTSISFRPIDWEGNEGYVRTLTGDEAAEAVLALKSYQSETRSEVTADRADTLNAFRLIPSGSISTGFDSVKWVNYISVTTAGGETGGETGGESGGEPGGTGTVIETLELTDTTVENGEATVTVNGSLLEEAAEEAEEDTRFLISGDLEGVSVRKVTTVIPMPAVRAVAASGAAILVGTPLGDVLLPNAALKDLAPRDGENLIVTVEAGSDGTTAISLAVDDTAVDTVSGGLKAVIPAAAGNVAVRVAPDGSGTVIPKSLVENGRAYVLLPGSAVVKVINNGKSFADVKSTDWYSPYVDFAGSHELFNGVGGDLFAPGDPMTRAMLVMVLHRLESTPDAGTGASFADVPGNTWYTDAVTWASENGIVNGYGGSLFGPGDNVTREQMAAILYRYMQYLGLDVSARGGLDGFTDGGETSAWAVDAMQWAVGAGILGGRDDGSLDPTGTATRAEVAAMLQRLTGLIVR